MNLNCDNIHRDNDLRWDPLYRDVIKCTRTERKFKVDFLENKVPPFHPVYIILYN